MDSPPMIRPMRRRSLDRPIRETRRLTARRCAGRCRSQQFDSTRPPESRLCFDFASSDHSGDQGRRTGQSQNTDTEHDDGDQHLDQRDA